MPAGDDLTIILFLFGLAATVGLTAFSLTEWRSKSVVTSLWLFAAVSLFTGICWLWLKDLSPKISEVLRQIASSPVSWFTTIMFLGAALLFNRRRGERPSPVATDLSAAAPEWVALENIYLIAGMTPQTTSPVLLMARSTKPTARLRIVLEYSFYFRSLGSAGWTKPRQIHLADLKDLIQGQDISLPIVSGKPNAEEIWWGTERDAAGNLISNSRYRAKLRFIDNNDKEQVYRFFLLRTFPDKPPYIVETFSESDLS